MVTVIAHRGWSGKFPENTLIAFKKAIELGVPAVELDVQATLDGKIVVIHDTTVERTTNGTGAVKDLTFAQIRQLNAGNGERVPTLEEILDLCVDRVAIQIEVKSEGIEHHLALLWERYGGRPDIYFTAFNSNSLIKFKKTHPNIPVALLDQTKFIRPGFQEDFASKLIKQAKNVGAFAIHLKFITITPSISKLIHDAGLLLKAWSVPRSITPTQIRASKIDGFTTNWPDEYKEFFVKKGEDAHYGDCKPPGNPVTRP